ncbi:unnamed protein product, partial [Cercopithifilaria johnstoni]
MVVVFIINDVDVDGAVDSSDGGGGCGNDIEM